MGEIITVKELLEFSIAQEYERMAHFFYWAVTQGVPLDADSKVLDTMQIDQEAIEQLTVQNVLGLGQIKLYVVKHGNYYAFYFAKNGLEVASYHARLFGVRPESVVEAARLLHKLMYICEVDEFVFLADYRSRYVHFPAYVGHASAGEYVLHRADQQGGKQVV